ncbi:MAG: hypothetical protein ACLTAF_16095 [Blautia coccoides]
MARIVSLPDFEGDRLAEEAPAERLALCLEITDELLVRIRSVSLTLDRLHLFLNVCLRQKTEKTSPES